MQPTWLQLLYVLFGAGALVQLIRLTWQQGRLFERVDTLWTVHQENVRLALHRHQVVERESPWTLHEVGAWLRARGGPDYSLRPGFLGLLRSPLPKHNLDLCRSIYRTFGIEALTERVQRLNEHLPIEEERVTLHEYIELLAMLLRYAAAQGVPALCVELGLDSVEGGEAP